ncbi:hypothetical protein A2Z33_00575 [Candidatus Gottesmanbacteria bacterium RBG_16_52_11]|uniref:Uncharacterized protein n=1 Tax=Candidatus Gottesmanbacteria bacterium RBG_16_52_11 TaxID=1798374 RepID=A0A1F5YN15_9BACT|nr:MAG: hypothetical protein A2Z33_00575 [Candidatus Gottesmanbacteria bacterium RBG_16_52_11]
MQRKTDSQNADAITGVRHFINNIFTKLYLELTLLKRSRRTDQKLIDRILLQSRCINAYFRLITEYSRNNYPPPDYTPTDFTAVASELAAVLSVLPVEYDMPDRFARRRYTGDTQRLYLLVETYILTALVSGTAVKVKCSFQVLPQMIRLQVTGLHGSVPAFLDNCLEVYRVANPVEVTKVAGKYLRFTFKSG